MLDAFGLLALLVGLELVLGVDNVLVIAIFVARLPESHRDKARKMGLGVAMLARLVMIVIVVALTGLTKPLLFNLSVRDIILLAGGMFLLYKAVKEIHHTVELEEEAPVVEQDVSKSYRTIITQIVLLDVVFSIDSVITAVGLTDRLWVIVLAVVLSFIGVLLYAKPIGDFIMNHPTVKILALSFLITIGVTIFMEGMHKHVPKGYIYLPMGFALMVDMLQMRYETNKKRKKEAADGSKA